MIGKRIILGFCWALAVFSAFSQTGLGKELAEKDTVIVNNLIKESAAHFSDDIEKARELAIQARDLAEQLGFLKGKAYALKNIGITYYFQGKYVETLDYYSQSVKLFEEIGDNVGMANLYSNIGVVYYDQGGEEKALENYLLSLKYSELAGDRYRTLIALNNIGGLYSLKAATYDKALENYLRALPICEELGKTEELGTLAVNIGFIYFDKKDDKNALRYFNKSLEAYGNSENSMNARIALGKLYEREGKYDEAMQNYNIALNFAEKGNDKISTIKSLTGLGKIYADQGINRIAINYFLRAVDPAREIKAGNELKDLYEEMAKAYNQLNDFRNAFKYQALYSEVKDTLYNIATAKKLGSLQFDFDLQKKQGEINLLTKDMALTDLKLKRQKAAKQALLVGLGLVLMIAILIFRNYRIKVKTHKILNKQKAEIEDLLLNILPAEVAGELQANGYSTPRNFESVSVLFTDFKGFTRIADKISPQELVKELSQCFVAFDNIISKYDLEKIKTIGDSYMCAGGIPTEDKDHVQKIIKAALEIRDFIKHYNLKRNFLGLEPWELRIGVHVGPVVAGVVGKKKYAYDIWGSTVNIASRMESNGQPGQVNISSSVYEIIKHDYVCSYRGKINAKNIGEIDMYFVGDEINKTGIVTHINTLDTPEIKTQLK
ncbi:MAG: tetratricopeptide repeat protein [Terrimonas sp.]|nr:tetratricopeptide repeat protein [Terrimonas sp.]